MFLHPLSLIVKVNKGHNNLNAAKETKTEKGTKPSSQKNPAERENLH